MKKFLLSLILLFSTLMVSAQAVTTREYNNLPPADRAKIDSIMSRNSVKGTLVKVSEYAGLGKEIGTAVNETLKAVESSAVRISETDLGKTAINVVVWKLLYKEILGVVIGIILLIIFVVNTIIAVKSCNAGKNGYPINIVAAIVTFVASMICMFS